MVNYKHYTYRVTWSVEDDECVALCAEFPSLSFLAPDPEKALKGIVDVVKDIIEDMASCGEMPPNVSSKLG